MNLNLLSKYRTQLMGIAILFIAFFHCSIESDSTIFNFFKFLGDFGVDIFFFISGIGMYYTMLKNPTYGQFCKKRLLRIVPAWISINLFIQLEQGGWHVHDWSWFLKIMTGLTFWLHGNLYFWYISAIIVFYALTPLFVQQLKKNIKAAYLGLGVIWIILLAVSLIFHNAKYFIVLFRVPVYFVGIGFGKMVHEKKEIKKDRVYAGILTCIFLIVVEFFIYSTYEKVSLIRYDYKYLAYFPLVICFCGIFSCLLEKIKYKFYILSFYGGISLEVYLLHEYMLKKCCILFGKDDSKGIIYNISVFLIVSIIAKVLHEIIRLLTEKNGGKLSDGQIN